MQLNTGAKVWLWIVFVINVISLIGAIPTTIAFGGLLWLTLILEVVIVASIALLLFKQQKLGFFLVCGCAVVAFIINVILGTNIIYALISAVVMPTVTFLLLKSQWNELR